MSTRFVTLAALSIALSYLVVACSDGTGDDPGGGVGASSGGDGLPGSGGDGTTGAGGADTGSGGGTGTGAGPSTEPTCGDASCDFVGGLAHGDCGTRFALGMNYAWHDFGTDFGGLSAWGQPGVAGNADIAAELAEMSENGATAIRWWMFPDFRGDGVVFDENDDATGISETAVTDIHEALELADAANVNVVFTIFSFDNFRPTRDEGGVTIRGMTPMVQDATRRGKLIEGVVRSVAEAAASSPHADRLLGWDVINEPEWAVQSGAAGAPSGGDFDPNDELDPITLTELKALINESLAVLEEVTPGAQKSVGWAAAKWQWAFDDVSGVDFHQPHIYAWVNDYWPYTQSPAQLGYDDGKPTVMGEFYLLPTPFSPSTTATIGEILESWFTNGYAGAWAWQYTDAENYAANLPELAAFATAKGCQVRY